MTKPEKEARKSLFFMLETIKKIKFPLGALDILHKIDLILLLKLDKITIYIK